MKISMFAVAMAITTGASAIKVQVETPTQICNALKIDKTKYWSLNGSTSEDATACMAQTYTDKGQTKNCVVIPHENKMFGKYYICEPQKVQNTGWTKNLGLSSDKK